MGQPAARVTDPHPKGPILQGSADVLIGGLSAARLGDAVRHGSGTDAIAEGEASVLINGMPAAREGDLVSCEEPILSGCGTVLIGKSQGHCMVEAAKSAAIFVTEL